MSARHIFGPVGSALVFIYTMSCSPLGMDLARDGSVRLDVQQNTHVDFRGIAVRQDEGGVEVSGTVRAKLGKPRPTGHVRVEVVDATGRTIAQADGRLRGQSPSARQRYDSRFRIKLPMTPSPDATVLVRYGA